MYAESVIMMNIEEQRNDQKNIDLIKSLVREDILQKMRETFNCNDARYSTGSAFDYIQVPLHHTMVTHEQLKKVFDLGIEFWIDFRNRELPMLIIPLE